MYRILLIFTLLYVSPCFANQNLQKLTREEQSILYNAQQALKQKSFQKAQNLISNYLNQDSTKANALMYYVLGNAFYMDKNIIKASKAYEKGYNLDKNSFELCINFAKTSYELNKYETAGALFEQAYYIKKPYDPELLFQSATAYYQAKKNHKAKKVLTRLMKTKRIKSLWLKLYVHVCLDLKQWHEAGKILQKFLNMNPENEEYWQLLAQIRLRQKNYKDAVSALEIAYRLKKPSSRQWEEIANLYLHLNFPLKALNCLKKAYGKHPGPKQCEQFADIYAQTQDLKSAVYYLNMAINQKSSDEYYFKKGRLFFEWGLWQKAIQSFEAALKINPQKAAAHLMKGYCALETENFKLAQKAFIQASKKEKYKKEALNCLEMIKSISP